MLTKYEKIVVVVFLSLAVICTAFDFYLVYQTQKSIDAYEEKIAQERQKQALIMEAAFKKN